MTVCREAPRDVGPHRARPMQDPRRQAAFGSPDAHSLPEAILRPFFPIEHQPPFDREQTMTERTFRLLERLQKLDALIARARQRRFADPFEIARLRKLKVRSRVRLAQLASPRPFAR